MNERKQTDIDLWHAWKANPTNQTLSPLLKAVEPIIVTHTNKLRGNLPTSAIKAQATKLTIQAFHNYDPDKAQLNTHLYSQLQKLKRYVYEHQNIGSIPEPRIIQIGTYKKVKTNLEDQLGRPPTTREIADEMRIPVKQIEMLQKEMRSDLIQQQNYVNILDDERSDIDEHIHMLYEELFGTDKEVLAYTYGLDNHPQLSQGDIATRLHISPSMVTQIKSRLANRLKTSGALGGY